MPNVPLLRSHSQVHYKARKVKLKKNLKNHAKFEDSKRRMIGRKGSSRDSARHKVQFVRFKWKKKKKKKKYTLLSNLDRRPGFRNQMRSFCDVSASFYAWCTKRWEFTSCPTCWRSIALPRRCPSTVNAVRYLPIGSSSTGVKGERRWTLSKNSRWLAEGI